MQLVGNDIVDLRQPECAGKALQTRFMDRVFSSREKKTILRSGDPDRMLWLHWAAKEAAYKIVSKALPQPAFAHRRFEVSVDGDVASCQPGCACEQQVPARVKYGDIDVSLRAFVTHGYVHALGWRQRGAAPSGQPRDLTAGVATHDPDDGTGPEAFAGSFSSAELLSIRTGESALVRLHARAGLARHLNLLQDRLQIVREGKRQPPRVLLDGMPTPIDLSLSHDGGFVAWVFASTGAGSPVEMEPAQPGSGMA